MRSLQLAILLTFLAVTLAAAEPYEHFVLSDGRQLVGSHDPVQERLHLAGPIAASVRVPLGAIVSRRPATSAEIPAAVDLSDSDDPVATRIARLRASLRGYDRAAEARARDRDALTRRIAEATAVVADLRQRHELLAAELAALLPERHRVQLMRDEVEQARALTELRVVSLTASVSADQPSAAVVTTISELTTELTAARARCAELSRELAAIDANCTQHRAAMGELQVRAQRQRSDVDAWERRLARYHSADEDGAAKRKQLAAILAQVESEAAAREPAVTE